MKIIVASKNPVKIQAAKLGFESLFPKEQFNVEGVSVPSGVRDQPMDDNETKLGALNRVERAKEKFTDADYWVGIEGGIENTENGMSVFAWIVIKGKSQIGLAKTASFFLPPKVQKLVNEGMELGHADDVVFGVSNSKQNSGALGLLTDDVLNRTDLYQPAVIMALIPFKKPMYYS